MLGLCALVFALIGIASGGAQAASPEWLVLEGTKVTEGTGGQLTLAKETNAILHSKISGVSVLFECPTIEAVEARLGAAGTIAEGKIKYSGCVTKLNGVESKPCEPVNAGTEKGVIVTKPGHAVFVLHEFITKDELTKVLPDIGNTLAVIEMSKECSIGAKVPVIGELFLKDCENKFLEHLERHLVEEGPLTRLFVISETEEHKASLLGSAWAKVLFNGLFRFYGAHAG